jgi:hypothetical protein
MSKLLQREARVPVVEKPSRNGNCFFIEGIKHKKPLSMVDQVEHFPAEIAGILTVHSRKRLRPQL